MTVTRHNTVVGVFEDRRAAQHAVAELQQVGFRDDQIGIVSRNVEAPAGEKSETGSRWEEGAAAGVAAGAGLGALWGLGIVAGVLPAVGPAIAGGILGAVLTSAAGGAATFGVLGALIGLGIPEEEARYYEGEFHAGRTLVTVQAPGRYEEACEILRRHGASNIESRPPAPPTMTAPTAPASTLSAGGCCSGNVAGPAPSVHIPVRGETPTGGGHR
jgi:hypothetical protein